MKQKKSDTKLLTDANGRPIDSDRNSLSAAKVGALLLQDVYLIEKLAHFDRERIPERVVHAKGSGAHGYFEVTQDVTKFCKAAFLNQVGKKTPAFARFSTVKGERGTGDTKRDSRGFSLKLYTEEGNWDMVGLNFPIFFINDPIKFPDLQHSMKKHPKTNQNDPNMLWDFISNNPESIHMITMLFSDRGIPDGFRHMHGFGTHTFKWVNDKGQVHFVKYHFLSNQGIKNISDEKGVEMEGTDPEYATKDLMDAIDAGDHPSWTFYIQAVTEAVAEKTGLNMFDVTKTWAHDIAPLIEVGKLVLDRNPENFHAEVEQACFSPGALVPGIEPSIDKLLQGRLFSYPDTQRYRVGTNFQQLPINCPYKTQVNNGQRDGSMAYNNPGDRLNYPQSRWGSYDGDQKYKITEFETKGLCGRYSYNDEEDFYSQARVLFEKTMNQKQRELLIHNIVNDIKGAAKELQQRQCALFYKVHPDYGNGVAQKLGITLNLDGQTKHK